MTQNTDHQALLKSDLESDDESQVNKAYQLELFYDHACPLCRKEIQFVRKLDRQQKIRFTDISSSTFDPEIYGKTSSQFMSEIHARLPDGSWIQGVEVFRKLYGLVGFRWIIPLTRLPGLKQLLDWSYQIFAKNRLKWTGRCSENGCSIAK